MKSYTFDIRLRAAITIEAATAAEALAQLRGDETQAMNCNGGAWADGSPILFEASMNERPDLVMIDGEEHGVYTLRQWDELNAMEARNNG